MSRSGATRHRDTTPAGSASPNDSPADETSGTPYDRTRITLIGSLLGWLGMTTTLMMVHLATHRYALGWLLLSALAWGAAIGVVFEMLMHARATDRARRPGGWLTALSFAVFTALALLLLAVAASWGPWHHG